MPCCKTGNNTFIKVRSMEYLNSKNIYQSVPTAITLGNFDGMHLGHKALIDKTKEMAEKHGLKSIIFSFYPHPMFLFGNRKNLSLILSDEEKLKQIEDMGIDMYVEYPFDKEFASTEPEEFARIIFEDMKCKVLVIGYDYHFGKGAKGNYDLLKAVGEKFDAEVIMIKPVELYGSKVSSTRIREALSANDIILANDLLGYPFYVFGRVGKGKSIGRTINFPTANIIPQDNKLFPEDGVYASKTEIDGKIYMSMTNVGTNPTVNGNTRTVETNVFDFSGDLYNKEIKTYFFDYIRGEIRFSSVEELSKRLIVDKELTKAFFMSEKYKKWSDKF